PRGRASEERLGLLGAIEAEKGRSVLERPHVGVLASGRRDPGASRRLVAFGRPLFLDVPETSEPDVRSMLGQPGKVLSAAAVVLRRRTKKVESDQPDTRVDIVL